MTLQEVTERLMEILDEHGDMQLVMDSGGYGDQIVGKIETYDKHGNSPECEEYTGKVVQAYCHFGGRWRDNDA